MKDVKLINVRGVNHSLRNIACGNGYDEYATVVDLMDAIEDGNSAGDIFKNVKALKLLGFYKPTLDKIGNNYIRIKATDGMGNIFYLMIYNTNRG